MTKEVVKAGDVGVVNAAALVNETRADRLTRLLLKALPHLRTEIESGQWGKLPVASGERVKHGPPYVFKTLEGGKQQLLIEDPVTGDRMGFLGTSRDELLDQLEAKLSK